MGSKRVFTKTSRSYTVFSARSTKPKEPFERKGRTLGAEPFSQTPQARRLLLESGLLAGKHKRNREPKSKTSPERDGFSPELDAGENFNSIGDYPCKQSWG